MTEQELTALATYWVSRPRRQKLGLTDGNIAVDLSQAYLALLADRDALRADLADRAEWHTAWVEAARCVQMLEAERDALKAQLEQARKELADKVEVIEALVQL